jgi:O-acetyl-ADP-ribose deacetylase (regulator of RNase III)
MRTGCVTLPLITSVEQETGMPIEYVIGDATNPHGSGPRIIVHVCTDVGGWGRGFVVALSRKWPEPERRYRAWHRGNEPIPFALGQVQFVPVAEQLWVANLIGQHDIRPRGGVPPVRYGAIRDGLQRVASFAQEVGATVHMPRIGAGLAGGKWDEISPIIEAELTTNSVPVVVYNLPS